MDTIDGLISIALDLTAAITTADRYERLLTAVGRVLPFDAAALLRIDGDRLMPVAARGLSKDALGRTYRRSAHPRLDIICSADDPVRFPADSRLPDPFDGLVATDASNRIHACLGCPLRVESRLIGVLTADAFQPGAFDHVDDRFLKGLSALAGAQMQTARLIEALEKSAVRQGQIACDLMQDIQVRQGDRILGSSPEMAHLRREIELVAPSDFTVLVLGETGVGKELVVRALHASSARRNAPLLHLNCAALPETLAESELFGHTRGAFTGAGRDRAGKFELADGGTLFLDEIGELPLAVQAKLLRAIQEGEIQRIGSGSMVHVNVRLLAATNRDLAVEVGAGRFRADLFHRLNVYPILVPPLRNRREDIPLLAGHFCERLQRRLGLGLVRINPAALGALDAYPWPGNVRELENVLSRAVLKAASSTPRCAMLVIGPEHLGADLAPAAAPQAHAPPQTDPVFTPGVSLREATRHFQISLIRKALARQDGNWAAAARDLGMHRSNLHHLATRLGMRKKRG